MIGVRFNTNNDVLLEPIKNILIHKFSYLDDAGGNFVINFNFSDSSLSIESKYNTPSILKLPLKVNQLIKVFEKFNTSIYFTNKELYFYPFKSELSQDNHKIYLTDIHNRILLNLNLYPKGLDKNNLYSLIWPKDKELLINKLDTHLTNLKKLIENNFDIQFDIRSNKGKLYLI